MRDRAIRPGLGLRWQGGVSRTVACLRTVFSAAGRTQVGTSGNDLLCLTCSALLAKHLCTGCVTQRLGTTSRHSAHPKAPASGGVRLSGGVRGTRPPGGSAARTRGVPGAAGDLLDSRAGQWPRPPYQRTPNCTHRSRASLRTSGDQNIRHRITERKLPLRSCKEQGHALLAWGSPRSPTGDQLRANLRGACRRRAP